MGRTLLYVDPDPATRLLVRLALEPAGYVVVEATGAGDGHARAREVRPDVIVVDVDRVRPAELLHCLGETPGLDQVPLVAATGLGWPGETARVPGGAFAQVLRKPLDVDRLPALVDDALVRDPPAREGATAGESLETTAASGASVAEGSVAPDRAPAVVGVAEVPPLWRLNLEPVTARLVRSVSTTHGLLALLDATGQALTVAATYSIRPRGDEMAPVGARVPLALAAWLAPVLAGRQPAVLATDGLPPSPLVPAGSSVVLALPVASGDRVLGVAVLGEQRSLRFAPFGTAAQSASLAEARHIASVIDALHALDAAVRRKRAELAQARLDATRLVLGSVHERLRPRRARRAEAARGRRPLAPPLAPEDGEALERLALDAAARLGLPAADRDVLRQAVAVLDVGPAWLEDVLFSRFTFPDAEREALLDGAAEHAAEILEALEWPAAVVHLVQAARGRWDEAPEAPLGARLLAALAVYARARRARPDDAAAARAALEADPGRLDPRVVAALAAVIESG